MIRILCVDDDPLMRTYLATRLAIEPDMKVMGVVGSAAEAMGYLARGDIDVVVLDYQMEGMTGIELLRAISPRTESDLDLRSAVLFCTGWADEVFFQEARDLGASGVVAKEQMSSDLIPAVRAVAARETWFKTLGQ